MAFTMKLLSFACIVFTCITFKQVSADITMCPDSDFQVNLTYTQIEECVEFPCPISVGRQVEIHVDTLLETPTDPKIKTLYFTTRTYGEEIEDGDKQQGEINQLYHVNPYYMIQNKDIPNDASLRAVSIGKVSVYDEIPAGKKFTMELSYWIETPFDGPRFCIQVDCVTKE